MVPILDISPLLSPRLALWPGDPPLALEPVAALAQGASQELHVLHTGLHAGAHVDAPSHIVPGGADISQLGLAPFLGLCEVVAMEVGPGERIPAEALRRARAPRVLFKTCSREDPSSFREDFPGLSLELIRHMKTQDCMLVGLDSPSVDPYASSSLEAHHALMEAGMAILEGLSLARVAPGLYTLVALPLKLERGDGSLVRAVLLPPETGIAWDS